MAANGSGQQCSDTQTVFDESMVLPNQIIRLFRGPHLSPRIAVVRQEFPGWPRGEARPPLPQEACSAVLINPLYLAPESAHAFPLAAFARP
jgi:hypothetical protein